MPGTRHRAEGFRLATPAVSVPGTNGKSKAPSIAVPWYDQGSKLVGVRYRFLEEQDGHKLTSELGSAFMGNIFGAHLLTIDPRMTLVICEGELNALSVWQIASHTRVDVLSLGSENSSIPDKMLGQLAQYGAIITWLDKPDHARRIAAKLPMAFALKSANGRDANDMLREGKLGKLITAARLQLCRSLDERMALLWDLYDGGLVAPGLDSDTAETVQWLSANLGQTVTLSEVGGAWYTGKWTG